MLKRHKRPLVVSITGIHWYTLKKVSQHVSPRSHRKQQGKQSLPWTFPLFPVCIRFMCRRYKHGRPQVTIIAPLFPMTPPRYMAGHSPQMDTCNGDHTHGVHSHIFSHIQPRVSNHRQSMCIYWECSIFRSCPNKYLALDSVFSILYEVDVLAMISVDRKERANDL